MKKTLLFAAALAWLFCSSPVLGEDAAADVKRTQWGMSKAQVKQASRQAPVKEEDGFLLFQYAFDNVDCVVYYGFELPGERLIEVSYVFKPASKAQADSLYSSLSRQIVQEYGSAAGKQAKGRLSSGSLQFERGQTSVTISNAYKINGTVAVNYTDLGRTPKGDRPAR